MKNKFIFSTLFGLTLSMSSCITDGFQEKIDQLNAEAKERDLRKIGDTYNGGVIASIGTKNSYGTYTKYDGIIVSIKGLESELYGDWRAPKPDELDTIYKNFPLYRIKRYDSSMILVRNF